MWLVAWLGFIAVYASMAEMASMAPTTGGELLQANSAEALFSTNAFPQANTTG
jgi:hypothetical protein